MILVALIILSVITFFTSQAASKRALDIAGRQDAWLISRVNRVALLGALSGVITADLFSSAYLRIAAGGMLSALTNTGRRFGRSRGDDLDNFGQFALISGVEHLFLMVVFSFVGAAAACWAYLRYQAARDAAGLPRIATPTVMPAPVSVANTLAAATPAPTSNVAPSGPATSRSLADTSFCHACGKEKSATDRFCPACGEPTREQ